MVSPYLASPLQYPAYRISHYKPYFADQFLDIQKRKGEKRTFIIKYTLKAFVKKLHPVENVSSCRQILKKATFREYFACIMYMFIYVNVYST
jgi:hypothetical protein